MPKRFNAILTEERNAQLKARYQQRLKEEREQQAPNVQDPPPTP